MKYFYDTEFLEGTQKKLLGNTIPTIDLISIGIVCEDGREFYAVSKDFNLKEAWNRYDIKTEQVYGDMRNNFPNGKKTKVYWIRENVLKPIFYDWKTKDINFHDINNQFTYKEFKRLLKKYGRTNKQIAEEIIEFCKPVPQIITEEGLKCEYQMTEGSYHYFNCTSQIGDFSTTRLIEDSKFYGYYSDYDHVALCWLFGKMIELPKGFPMYTIDLKQSLDEYAKEFSNMVCYSSGNHTVWSIDETIKHLKSTYKIPSPKKGHHALEDARYNYELYKFLK